MLCLPRGPLLLHHGCKHLPPLRGLIVLVATRLLRLEQDLLLLGV